MEVLTDFQSNSAESEILIVLLIGVIKGLSVGMNNSLYGKLQTDEENIVLVEALDRWVTTEPTNATRLVPLLNYRDAQIGPHLFPALWK